MKGRFLNERQKIRGLNTKAIKISTAIGKQFSETFNWNRAFRNQKVGTRHSETKGGTGHSETKGGVNGAFRNQWGC